MYNQTKRLIGIVAGMVIAATSLLAAPAIRKPQTIQQPDGSTITIVQQGDEWCHWVTNLNGDLLVMDSEGNYHVATLEEETHWEAIKAENLQKREEVNRQRMESLRAGRKGMPAITAPGENHAASFPSKGQINGLIVLVQYSDVSFAGDSTSIAQHYQDMINSEGYNSYNHQGSAHDYYIQNSLGQFDPQFDIYGPITLSHNRQYYGKNDYWGNDSHAWEMLTEACQQLDSIVDFNKYDNDQDGMIDFVFAFYAGGGEHAGAGSNTVWPHARELSSATGQSYFYDGVRLNRYACSCEQLYGQPDGVGTFCHEFTHVLGLPDIYDINYSYSTFTPGDYDILDQGSYNGITSGSCPAGVNTYERYELGWIEPEILTAGTSDTLIYLGESNKAYILPVKSTTDDPRDGEYYLFENRQQTAWDAHIPGHGMLAWHIDYQENKWYSNSVNTSSDHQCVDIVEADDTKSQTTRAGDPFPGSRNVREFSATTTPALLGWDSSSGRGLHRPINGAALSEIREESIPEISDQKVIIFSYTDEFEEVIPEEVDSTLLFLETFDSITNGADNKVTGSSVPFRGSESIVAFSNAYQAGGALRIGKSTLPGSLTTRNIGNAEGDSLRVELMVKGWLQVEGCLLVSYLNGEEYSEPITLEYSAAMSDDYELLSCMMYDVPADVQLHLSTDNKRCFISNIRVSAPKPEKEQPEEPIDPEDPNKDSIHQVVVDQAAKHSASKVWSNGRLMISTCSGTFNMQGIRQ